MNRTFEIPAPKKQLDPDTVGSASRNITDRMTAAHRAITKIREDAQASGRSSLTALEKKNVDYLAMRIEQLQISYRLIYDTNWIVNMQQREIPIIKEALRIDQEGVPEGVKAPPKLLPTQIFKFKFQLKAFEGTQKCKKCRAYGYNGEKISTGEFNLCGCVLNYLSAYKQL